MNQLVNIIVVDDHDVVRTGIIDNLKNFEQYKVVASASTEEEAVKAFSENDNVDLLIIDIALQEVNTFNFVRNLKKKTPKLKVLFISGFTEDEYHDRMRETGADGFWCKLENLENLFAKIDNALNGSRGIDNGIKNNCDGDSGPILSNREEQIVACIARGMTVKEVAEKFSLSTKTVEAHKSNLMVKLNLHSQVDLVRWAIRHGLATA